MENKGMSQKNKAFSQQKKKTKQQCTKIKINIKPVYTCRQPKERE